ncbi:MAG: M67 family metallopeptidase [Acidimicrobiales bacterium]
MLRLPADVHAQILGHCLAGLPDEACGLLGGHPQGGQVVRCYPTTNAAASAKLYVVDAKEHLLADRDAEGAGLEIIGVFHSHTHTDAYPSPTDIAQAPDPAWHYVLVSLRHATPALRSYRIVDATVAEEPVLVGDR